MRSSTALTLGVALVAAWAWRPRALKERAEAVIAASADGETEAVVRRAYARVSPAELSPDHLKSVDNRTLELAFDAVLLATAGDRDDSSIEILGTIEREALSRGYLGLGDMPQMLFERALARRNFSAAAAVSRDFSSLAARLPRLTSPPPAASVPAVLSPSVDGHALTWRPVRLGPEPRIIAIVSPGCHFSRDAMKRISTDAGLKELFAARAEFVDPSPAMDFEAIAKANRSSWFRYDLLYKPEGWPVMDLSSTPQFYVFKDGRIVGKVAGFEPKTFAGDLRKALFAAGLDATSERGDKIKSRL